MIVLLTAGESAQYRVQGARHIPTEEWGSIKHEWDDLIKARDSYNYRLSRASDAQEVLAIIGGTCVPTFVAEKVGAVMKERKNTLKRLHDLREKIRSYPKIEVSLVWDPAESWGSDEVQN